MLAVFGLPRVHEDDALRAVRAVWDMSATLASLNVELGRDRGVTLVTRTGINTGEVIVGDPSTGQRLATGDAMNVAARLEQAAAPGEVLLGEDTFRLVKDAIESEAVTQLSLKGKTEPVPAYRLVAVISGAEGSARRLDAPLVGRADELLRLTAALDRAVSRRSCERALVLGEAGLERPVSSES